MLDVSYGSPALLGAAAWIQEDALGHLKQHQTPVCGQSIPPSLSPPLQAWQCILLGKDLAHTQQHMCSLRIC